MGCEVPYLQPLDKDMLPPSDLLLPPCDFGDSSALRKYADAVGRIGNLDVVGTREVTGCAVVCGFQSFRLEPSDSVDTYFGGTGKVEKNRTIVQVPSLKN